jgi:hypothetical protein
MVRVIHQGNHGVYVLDERGAPHHRPHAHIKNRGRRVASVFLETLDLFNVVERVPDDVVEAIRAGQERLLDRWEELNGNG